jgi:hypothetical protein
MMRGVNESGVLPWSIMGIRAIVSLTASALHRCPTLLGERFQDKSDVAGGRGGGVNALYQGA